MESASFSEDTAAVRHLLRHLDDGVALRENRLAIELSGNAHAGIDAGVIRQRVRRSIINALDTLNPDTNDCSRSAQRARRLRAIIDRCDLHDEPHRVVAADLGICNRQFYRERREALARLAQLLKEQAVVSEQHEPAIDMTNDVALQLHLVSRLKSVGQFATASEILARLGDQPLPPIQRAMVTHLIVDAFCDEGRAIEAQALLAKTKRELLHGDGTDLEAAVIRAELLAAEAILTFDSGAAASAIGFAERALYELRPYLSSNVERVRSLVVELSIIVAQIWCEAGSFERAIDAVESAKAFLDDRTDPATAAMLHFSACQAHVVLPWGLNKALQENNDAFAIARRSGYARHEASALANFCAIHFLRGRYEDAVEYGRKALLVSEVIAAPLELAVLFLNMARVAIAMGNHESALESLTRAKQHACGNQRIGAMIGVVEAEALTSDGRFEAAAATALSARRVFEKSGAQKQLGIALCAEARAYAGLSKKRSAISTIHGAIDVAEHFGSAYSLSEVYRASAQITGNKHHAANAEDIDSALRC